MAGIAHVIKYNVPATRPMTPANWPITPDTADAYQHRVGRTGRVDQLGEALTLSVPASWLMTPEDEPIVRQIERLLGQPFQGHRPVGQRKRLGEFNYGGSTPKRCPRAAMARRPRRQGMGTATGDGRRLPSGAGKGRGIGQGARVTSLLAMRIGQVGRVIGLLAGVDRDGRNSASLVKLVRGTVIGAPQNRLPGAGT